MKDTMLSLDIYAWIKENRDNIEGGFFKKIYQIGEREFLFKIYKNETRALYVNLRGWIYFAEKETPLEPSMFVMFLRKRFSGKRIMEISQIGFDRIVKISADNGYTLIIELFGDGNIIVVKDGIIERAFVEREWRHRAILRGEEYTPPPGGRHPLGDINEICEILHSSKYDVVRTLARTFNFGKYAEEICIRANVDKNSKSVSDEECERLKEAVLTMFEFDGGYIYEDFFSPIPLKMYSSEPKHFETFNEALKNYVISTPVVESEEIMKIRRRIDDIKKSIDNFTQQEETYRSIGDLIYAHFGEVEEYLKKAREGLIDYDRKRKILKLTLENKDVELDIRKSAGENASIYYEKAKKLKEKIKGAKEALQRAEEELQRVKKAEKKRKSERNRNRRRFWFEKYRWFISSEDILVIAGRDAKTNEEVVKKHLGQKDLYMHADIHGAPSVVIKSEGKEIGENTLREAAQFAVSMSKAWNAGFGNMSAYWVYPSQVSKMGESGEYVSKGAWVVHGKRNYFHHVPLRLALGMIEFQGVKLLMCGPVDSVISRCSEYIIIEPGDIKKEDFAKKIAKIFDVPVDEVMKILPPGKIRIVESKGVKI